MCEYSKVGVVVFNDEYLKTLGFVRRGDNAVFNFHVKDLGRYREMSLWHVGSPNEMLFISELERGPIKNKVSDAVVLHNYDYDGQLTKERLEEIVKWFDTAKKKDDNER